MSHHDFSCSLCPGHPDDEHDPHGWAGLCLLHTQRVRPPRLRLYPGGRQGRARLSCWSTKEILIWCNQRSCTVITGFEELPSFSRLPVILQYFVATANCKMVKNKTSFIHKNCSGVEPIFRSSSSIFFEIEKLTTRSRCWSWTFGWVPVTARKGRLRFGISLFFCIVPTVGIIGTRYLRNTICEIWPLPKILQQELAKDKCKERKNKEKLPDPI